jgi:molybdenum cofactor cytidylyltransferase
MGTSVSRGVPAFEDIQGILVMTCDMPAATADHLSALARSEKVAASSYGRRNGVPAYFPKDLFPKLLELEDAMGARELLQLAHGVELPGGELDVDTIEDLARARSIFG